MEDFEKEAIENFLLDIDSLDEITSKLSKFNVFETLGLVNMELKHSNVLSWLLNPKENHGLDEVFIKKFIQIISKKNKEYLENHDMGLIYLSLLDYSGVIVKREWNNIDVLVASENEKFVVVIENKIWSKEHSDQLTKYRNIIEDEYSGFKKIYLYLTPNGESPSDDKNWLAIDYLIVQEALNDSLELIGENIGKSVKLFIEQYMDILRRYIVGNGELEKICTDIYYKHQKALDLIFNYKPDIFYDISKNIENIIGRYENFIIDRVTKNYIDFTTKELDEIIPKGDAGWTPSKRMLLYEVQNLEGKVVLKCYIGPGDDKTRQQLFDISEKNKEVFKGKTNKHSLKWTQIYSKDIMAKGFVEKYGNNIDDINNEIEEKIEKLIYADVKDIEKVILEQFRML